MSLWGRLFGKSKNRKLQEEKKNLEEQRIKEEFKKREEALIQEEERFQNEVRLWKERQLAEKRKIEEQRIKEEQKKRKEERIKEEQKKRKEERIKEELRIQEEERFENEVRLWKERQLEEQRKQEALRKKEERKKQENQRELDVSDDSDNLIEQIGYDNYKMILEVKARSDRILKEFRERTAEIVKEANEKNLRFVKESNDKKAVDTDIILNNDKDEIDEKIVVEKYLDTEHENGRLNNEDYETTKKIVPKYITKQGLESYFEEMFENLYNNDEDDIDKEQIEYEEYLDAKHEFYLFSAKQSTTSIINDTEFADVPNTYYEEMFENLYNNDEDEIYKEQREYEQFLDFKYEEEKWLEEYEITSNENDTQLEMDQEEDEADEIINLDDAYYFGYYFNEDYDNHVLDLRCFSRDYFEDNYDYDCLLDLSDDFMFPIYMYLQMCRIYHLDSAAFTLPEIVQGVSFLGKKAECIRITDISLARMDDKLFECFVEYVCITEKLINDVIDENIAREFEEEMRDEA